MSYAILPADAVRAAQAYATEWLAVDETRTGSGGWDHLNECLVDVAALRRLHDTDPKAWRLIVGLERRWCPVYIGHSYYVGDE